MKDNEGVPLLLIGIDNHDQIKNRYPSLIVSPDTERKLLKDKNQCSTHHNCGNNDVNVF